MPEQDKTQAIDRELLLIQTKLLKLETVILELREEIKELKELPSTFPQIPAAHVLRGGQIVDLSKEPGEV